MSVTHPRIERVGLQDQVYHVLKERALDRTYPPGARLNVDAPARELAVSSPPMRRFTRPSSPEPATGRRSRPTAAGASTITSRAWISSATRTRF